MQPISLRTSGREHVVPDENSCRSLADICAAFSRRWLLPALVLTAVGCGDESIEVEDEDLEVAAEQDTIELISSALTPTQPFVRRTIYDLPQAERQALANAILAFITQPVLDEHMNSHDWHHPSVGVLFFSRHHDYLKELEDYLVTNNLRQFVPVPEWNPGTPIPDEFMVADPLVTQARMNQNPDRPVPPEFADDQLCNFADSSRLAVAVEDWHDGVHTAIGGPMVSLATAPGAPIFWLWHAFLDDMYHERTWRCETQPALVAAENVLF